MTDSVRVWRQKVSKPLKMAVADFLKKKNGRVGVERSLI